MKRTAILLLTLLLCCCAGCRAEPPLHDSFTADFQTTYNGPQWQGTLTRTADGVDMTFFDPYTVSGLRVTYAGDRMQICCGDLTADAGSDLLSEASLPCLLYTTLLYLNQAQYTGDRDGEDHYTVPTPNGEAEITARDGIPASIILPKNHITVKLVQS